MTTTDTSTSLDAATPGPAAPAPAVPRWAIHRRLYDWMLTFSHTPYATAALCMFSFCEAIFFPVPPFVLQIPMTLERRSRAWWYAGVTTVSSVLGGVVGYGVGHLFSDWVRAHVFSPQALQQFERFSSNIWLLTGGAIAVHPYKLYTIAAGIFAVPLSSFIIASVIGRGLLFFGIAALLWLFGAPIKILIEKYFTLLTVLLGALIVGVVVAAKVL